MAVPLCVPFRCVVLVVKTTHRRAASSQGLLPSPLATKVRTNARHFFSACPILHSEWPLYLPLGVIYTQPTQSASLLARWGPVTTQPYPPGHAFSAFPSMQSSCEREVLEMTRIGPTRNACSKVVHCSHVCGLNTCSPFSLRGKLLNSGMRIRSILTRNR